MTGLKEAVSRRGEIVDVDIDEMTSRELARWLENRCRSMVMPPQAGWMLAAALAEWIRLNVVVVDGTPTRSSK